MRKKRGNTPAEQRPRANPFGAADLSKLHQRRQEANRRIVRMLATAVEQHPSLRFNQILSSLGYQMDTAEFYEEPWLTSAKVATAMGDLFGVSAGQKRDVN